MTKGRQPLTIAGGGFYFAQREVVKLAKHLTDKEKKKIIADYVECGSYNAVAKKYKVSATTVKNTVLKDNKSVEKCEQKKEQNTADILTYMDGKKQDVCEIISIYLKALKDPDKLERASIQSIATSLGIIIDKFTKDAEKPSNISLFENIVKAAGGKFETNSME